MCAPAAWAQDGAPSASMFAGPDDQDFGDFDHGLDEHYWCSLKEEPVEIPSWVDDVDDKRSDDIEAGKQIQAGKEAAQHAAGCSPRTPAAASRKRPSPDEVFWVRSRAPMLPALHSCDLSLIFSAGRPPHVGLKCSTLVCGLRRAPSPGRSTLSHRAKGHGCTRRPRCPRCPRASQQRFRQRPLRPRPRRTRRPCFPCLAISSSTSRL